MAGPDLFPVGGGRAGAPVPASSPAGALTPINAAPIRGTPLTAISATPIGAAPVHHGGGGVFGFLGREASAFGHDVINTAEQFPTGIEQMAKANFDLFTGNPTPAVNLLKNMGVGMWHDVQHPLRHPFNTALDVASLASLGAGTALRLGAVGRAAAAAAEAGDTADLSAIARAAIRNPARTGGPRMIARVGERPTVEGKLAEGPAPANVGIAPYSRSGIGMISQKLSDALATRIAEGGGRLSERADNLLDRRVAKMQARAEKATQVQVRAAGTRVIQLGRKADLSPAESRALRIVAETVPYDRVLQAFGDRVAQSEQDYANARTALGDAKTALQRKKARRAMAMAQEAHQNLIERLGWTQDAGEFLTHDAEGFPRIKPEYTRLQEVYDAMEKAAGSREGLLRGAHLMDDETFGRSIAKQARMAAGAEYVKPTPGRLGKVKGLDEARKRVALLEARMQKRVEKLPDVGFDAVQRPRTREEAEARLADLEAEHNKALDTYAQGRWGPIDMSEVRRRTWENAKAKRQAAGVTKSGKLSGASTVKAVLRPTVKEERRALADREVFDAIERNPDHPTLQRWANRITEMDQLRDALTPNAETVFGPSTPGETRYAQIGRRLAEIRQRQRELVDAKQAAISRGDEPGNEAELARAREGSALSGEYRNLVAEQDRIRRTPGALPAEPDYGTISEFRNAHPSVERLGGALSVARDNLERLEARADAMKTATGLVGAEDVAPGEHAIYVGSQTAPPRWQVARRVSSSGTFGHTRKVGSFRQATGLARQYGAERNDVTELIGEHQHEAAQLTSLKRTVEMARRQGTQIPTRPDDVFLWTDGNTISSSRIPDVVAKYLKDPNSVTPAEKEAMKEGGFAAGLRSAIMERAPQGLLQRQGDWSVSPEYAQRLQDAADGKGVFVPRRVLGERTTQPVWRLPPGVVSKFNTVNDLGRLALIYLKVNYPIVQGLSNVAMNLIQQGVFAPRNLSNAIMLNRRIGPELTAMVDDAVEQGFAGQVLRGRGKGPIGRGTAQVAHYAGKAADAMPRRAAWLHEAYAQGYRTKAQIESLLTDPSKLGDLVQVTQRAKEAIVDFGDLTPFEHDFVRNLVFVYPWMKGSTVWAGRFLRDHPIQASALAHLGQLGAGINQQVFGDRPTYEMNMVPIGNRAIDLASLNPFATPAELGRSLAGFVRAPGSMPAESLASYASPAVSLAMGLVSGRDEGGFPLKGNLAQRIRQEMITQSPVSTVASAYLPGAVTHALFGAPIQSKTYPNQNIALKFALGGLDPRVFDRAALNQAAAYQKAPPR